MAQPAARLLLPACLLAVVLLLPSGLADGLSVTSSSTSTAPISSLATTPAIDAPLPLGKYAATKAVAADCPSGFTCHGFKVACPKVAAVAKGDIAMRTGAKASNGRVVFFAGGWANAWWDPNTSPDAQAFFKGLDAAGLTAVQVRWSTTWTDASPGERAGPEVLACRPATVLKQIHNEWRNAGGRHPSVAGRCGFCASGNSNGATQITYAVASYGLDRILDAVLPTGGPPLAALAKGCLRDPLQVAYWYTNDQARHVDLMYGFASNGPCIRHDATWTARWTADSVEAAGSDVCVKSRLHFLFGGLDATIAPAHAQDYVARVKSCSTDVSVTTVPLMPHELRDSAPGYVALKGAILAR